MLNVKFYIDAEHWGRDKNIIIQIGIMIIGIYNEKIYVKTETIEEEKHNVKTNDATSCPSCIIRRFISRWQWQSRSLNKKYVQFLKYLE